MLTEHAIRRHLYSNHIFPRFPRLFNVRLSEILRLHADSGTKSKRQPTMSETMDDLFAKSQLKRIRENVRQRILRIRLDGFFFFGKFKTCSEKTTTECYLPSSQLLRVTPYMLIFGKKERRSVERKTPRAVYSDYAYLRPCTLCTPLTRVHVIITTCRSLGPGRISPPPGSNDSFVRLAHI